ncbi:hypothetical protein CHUAL_003221 [Chamberlinius hualienensis]
MQTVKWNTYNLIMVEIKKLNRRTLSKSIELKFPNVSVETLKCILAQDYQRKTKRNHFYHHKTATMKEYYSRYLNRKEANEPPGFLTRISDEADLSPSLMAKIILEQYLTEKCGKAPSNKLLVSSLKDTTLIDCPVLSTEIYLCTINDEHYGPLVDAIKLTLGSEYECKLKKKLSDMGIPFIDETVMRAEGYPKTPDVKLEVPIAINGKVINWIESKALFGDHESHEAYLSDQLWSYWNRFGSGLVIYWFGFIEEIDKYSDKGIIVRYDFPSEVTRMDPVKMLFA